MQCECELEENDRRLLLLAAFLEQRQERTVVLDRFVDGVLLARLVSRA